MDKMAGFYRNQKPREGKFLVWKVKKGVWGEESREELKVLSEPVLFDMLTGTPVSPLSQFFRDLTGINGF